MNSWAVFTLLITTAYSSGLVSHLTVPTYSKPLDTIRTLVEADIYWTSTYYPAMEILFDIQVCVSLYCTYFRQHNYSIDTMCLHYLPHVPPFQPSSGTHVYCWVHCSQPLPLTTANVYGGYILPCLLGILGCNCAVCILLITLNCLKSCWKLKWRSRPKDIRLCDLS
jgi:hypothetical protein